MLGWGWGALGSWLQEWNYWGDRRGWILTLGIFPLRDMGWGTKARCDLFTKERILTLPDLISRASSAPHFNFRERQEAGVHFPLWVQPGSAGRGEADEWE
jgi:hypothetical protein